MARKRQKKKDAAKKQPQKGELSKKQLDKIAGGAFPTAVNDQITD